MDQDIIVVLKTFSDYMNAKDAQTKLSQSGIKSFLQDENVLGMDPVAGVELKIFKKDLEKAIMVLNA